MKRLPLTIGGDILVRKVDQQGLKGRFTIFGARTGNFIIIEEPVVRLNERLFTRITGDIFCRYLHEGDVFDFHSRVRSYVEGGMALIDYPAQFKQSTLRKHPRIRINLETKLSFRNNPSFVMTGTMTDISEGGCRLTLHTMHEMPLESPVVLTFTLPDKAHIQDLNAIIRTGRRMKLRSSTDLGLQFVGPPEELRKIVSFCKFCMFFEV